MKILFTLLLVYSVGVLQLTITVLLMKKYFVEKNDFDRLIYGDNIPMGLSS